MGRTILNVNRTILWQELPRLYKMKKNKWNTNTRLFPSASWLWIRKNQFLQAAVALTTPAWWPIPLNWESEQAQPSRGCCCQRISSRGNLRHYWTHFFFSVSAMKVWDRRIFTLTKFKSFASVSSIGQAHRQQTQSCLYSHTCCCLKGATTKTKGTYFRSHHAKGAKNWSPLKGTGILWKTWLSTTQGPLGDAWVKSLHPSRKQ